MGDGSLTYAVLISGQAPARLADIAQALAAARKVPFQDMMQAVRRSWGIIEDGAAKPAAEATVQALEKAGIKSVAVPSNLVEELPPAEPLAGAQFSPDGLFPVSKEGGAPRLVWQNLALVAAAGYKETEIRHIANPENPDMAKKLLKTGLLLMAGIPPGFGGAKKQPPKAVEVSDLVFVLDLVFKEPARRLRIDARHFDFSCLKERMRYDALGNFKILLDDAARLAPLALLNRGAMVLLEKRPVREMGYEALSDMERECRWLLTLEALKPR